MKNNSKKKRITRYAVFIICMLFIFSIIISKLVQLQIVNAEDYRAEANKNSHKVLTTTAPRGEIFDRDGNVLATNRQSFILIFTKTDESEKHLFETMTSVFEILDKYEEKQYDDFPIKINPFSFHFSASWQERIFKIDRGFDFEIRKEFLEGKKMEELSEEDRKKVDEKLKEITAEEAFYKLIKKYKLYDLIKNDYDNEKWKNQKVEEKIKLLTAKYDLDTIRRYMIIKDTILMNSYSGYKPVVVANDLNEKTSYIFEQIQAELPGISVVKQPVREYPYNELASAVIGYIRKVSPNSTIEKEKYEEKGYDISSDYIGKAGIESVYENYLRGMKGLESIEVNKVGRKVKTLGELTPYPGKSIQLTIDKDIQMAAEKALDKEMVYLQKLKDKKPSGGDDDADKSNATRGAAVVLDVNTGAVLALASRPGYDPNLFAVPGRLSDKDFRKYFNPNLEKFGNEYIKKHELAKIDEFLGVDISDKSEEEKEKYILSKLFPLLEGSNSIRGDYYDIYPKPTYNYAALSLIPPGSIFKPLTSIAGLEEEVIDESEKIYDAGPYNKRYKDFKGASWMYNVWHGTHGLQNVIEALRDSNNYYYFEVADRLFEKGGLGREALDMIAKYAWKFGLGNDHDGQRKAKTGLEIKEYFGQVYNYESSKNNFAVLYTRQLYSFLRKGVASLWGINYKGIDIIPNEHADSEEVLKVKKYITELIKQEMKNEKRSNFSEVIRPYLIQLIDMQEELKGQYKDSDIESMIAAINSSINDARTEMISGTNLYNASIGQGMNQFTPVQLANYVATMVNGGHRHKVHIVEKILDADKNIVENYGNNPQILEETGVSQSTIDTVKKGMLQVTTVGTANDTFGDFPIPNGGKTGSATFNSDYQGEIGRTSYATYIGFAPYDKPEIAVCVVIFDGGHGGYVAPVAKAVYEEYFKDEILKINPNYEFMFSNKD